MVRSCRLSPVVQKRNGTKIEEKDSKLFKDIKKAVGDRDTAWQMWAYTKTTEFKNSHKDVELDELGEVTFPSLIRALGLEDVYNTQKDAEETARDYGFDKKVFENPGTAVDSINEFNSEEDKFVAVLHKTEEGHQVEVLPRNGANIDVARQQSYNHALTGEILNILRSMGFSVEFASDSRYNGIFDPENTTLHDGLLTVIRVAKGEQGEDALPEEFSHLIIEGLISHPLVQRLLATLDDEQIKSVLGDSYDKYRQMYNGDALKMKKEAAGQLLAQYITGQGTISRPVIQPKRPLLARIWNWAKRLFSKITNSQLNDARERAFVSVAGIYNMIATGEAVPLIDKRNIMSAEKLYALKKEFDNIEKIAVAGETITAKMLQTERRNSLTKERTQKTSATLQKIRDLHESDKSFDSVVTFLNDTKRQMEIITSDMIRAKKNEEEGWMGNMQLINEAAKTAREIDTFVQGYEDIIKTIASFDSIDDKELAALGINEASAQALASMAGICMKMLNSLTQWRQATSRNIVYASARTVYKDDKVRGIGSKKNEIMSLEQILEHADRDISFVDRWFSALSDADDAYLTLFDGIVKNQQYERDAEMREWNAQIAAIDKKLRDAGYSSDFMFERNKDGDPTGRIISIYDWESYNEDRKNYQAFLREMQEKNGWTQEEYSKKLRQWKNGADPKTHLTRLIKVYVDPEIDKLYREMGEKAVPDDAVYEEMPNPKLYSKNVNLINNLAPAQREYYEKMMDIKRQMMTKIPHRGQGIYKAIYISKDFIEGIIDNTTSNPMKATLEHYKKKFVRRPDDIGFGTNEDFSQIIKEIIQEDKDSMETAEKILHTLAETIDDDILIAIPPKKIKRIIDKYNRMVNSNEMEKKDAVEQIVKDITETVAAENFYIVDTDFADNKIQKLPIYYTRPLKDMRMLSTDFSGSITAYSAMAVNYEKMNEVVDILEVGRSYAQERAVLENEGNKPLISKITALGKVYKGFVERAGNGTNTVGRLNDYMSSVVYEERKEDEGSFEVLGVNLDVAKTLDAIKDYTGLLGLGFNIFSTISNLAVGKLQQWIEAAGGEYFTVKDYAKAIRQYSSLIGGCVAEMNSPVKKNKLSLLIQMFDPMGDYYESLRDSNYSKSAVSRILGNGVLAYVGMNAGEHALHCQTMLAILNNIKLTNTKTKDKISLYDALEVKEVNGITKLVLKEDLAYERELVDNTGTPASNKNYGKPLLDENGKIRTELVPLHDPSQIKDSVHEQYEDESRKITRQQHGSFTGREKPKTSLARDYYNFIFKKKRVIRKVNDSLNGAFGVNDKGAIHKYALGRLLIQFRQWMPAHYMRRFARAHYDNDLEQWREGYYITVAKTLNQMRKEARKSGIKCLAEFKNLNEHEKANLRRATAEISEFLMLLALVRLGGRVKDRDRSWLDRMALYQIRRMYLEVGASMPVNGGFFSNIFQLLQSPAASISTFEKITKVLNFFNAFDEIQTGRYQGWSEWERDVYNMVPALGQISKAVAFDDSMFSQFERED